MKRHTAVPLALLAFITAACAGDAGDGNDANPEASAAAPASAAPQRTVVITDPADGDTVQGPALTVTMQSSGFAVVAAGDSTPNSGHLHLFLDRDLSVAGAPIPVEPGQIVHLGTGAATYSFENVPPGQHRLIAVVGDAVHVPLQPWVTDTVDIVVR